MIPRELAEALEDFGVMFAYTKEHIATEHWGWLEADLTELRMILDDIISILDVKPGMLLDRITNEYNKLEEGYTKKDKKGMVQALFGLYRAVMDLFD